MSKRFIFSLSLFSILFLFLYGILSYYSRLATDDYYFIGDIKNHGVFEQVFFQYKYWSGRYAATLPINIIYNIFGLKQTYYHFLPPLSLFILILGIFYLLKNLAISYSIVLQNFLVFLYSICIAALFFFLSYDIAESWFWYCGYSSYLWSLIALIWGIGLLLHENCKWYITLLASICFFYIGGASELYSSLIALFYLIMLFIQYKQFQNYKLFWHHPFYKKTITVYVIFCIAFLLLLIAPGNYVRDVLFPEHSFLKAFTITAKSVIKFFILYLPSKLIYLFCFIPLFILLGNYVKHQLKKTFQPFKTIFKKTTTLFISTLLLFFYLTAYVMVETGPARVLLFVSFIFTCYIIFISFYAGLTLVLKKERMLKFFCITCSSVLLLFHIMNQTLITSNYAKANDERIAYILDLKQKIKKDTLIVLTPLPPSGMVYSSEINMDTSHFTNRELQMGYNLPFHVIRGLKNKSI